MHYCTGTAVQLFYCTVLYCCTQHSSTADYCRTVATKDPDQSSRCGRSRSLESFVGSFRRSERKIHFPACCSSGYVSGILGRMATPIFRPWVLPSTLSLGAGTGRFTSLNILGLPRLHFSLQSSAIVNCPTVHGPSPVPPLTFPSCRALLPPLQHETAST